VEAPSWDGLDRFAFADELLEWANIGVHELIAPRCMARSTGEPQYPVPRRLLAAASEG